MKYLVSVLAAAVAALALAAGALSAPGKGAATPFKVTWTTGFTGYCSGAHIVNSHTGMVKDSETCLLVGDTSMLVAGTYSGDPYASLPWTFPHPWVSDYDGTTIATHFTATFVDNGDGTWTMYVVAYY